MGSHIIEILEVIKFWQKKGFKKLGRFAVIKLFHLPKCV